MYREPYSVVLAKCNFFAAADKTAGVVKLSALQRSRAVLHEMPFRNTVFHHA
jgi:hypothetical protein